MKVEKAFTIDGLVVTEAYRQSHITVYEYLACDNTLACYYFVDTVTGDIVFKQTIEADMSQGTGYISDVVFEGMEEYK